MSTSHNMDVSSYYHVNRKSRKGGTNLEITDLKREDEKAWDSYVLNSNSSPFYHQLKV